MLGKDGGCNVECACTWDPFVCKSKNHLLLCANSCYFNLIHIFNGSMFVYTQPFHNFESKDPLYSMSGQPSDGDNATNGGSRAWSCGTLKDGLDHLLQESDKCDEQEKNLNQMIQDLNLP